MGFNELDLKRIEKEMNSFIEKRRPPAELRNKVDLGFRIENYSVIIFETRPVWNNPSEKRESPVAKTTFVNSDKTWKIFWQKSDLKWHKYDPLPSVKMIEEFIEEVDRDQYGCFWG